MQIEIDFEVFKALTAKRLSEADSYNDVIRRILALPPVNPDESNRDAGLSSLLSSYSMFPHQSPSVPGHSTLAQMFLGASGAWFGNVHFPEGTKFRATYKGRTYRAEIKDGMWMGEDGVKRTSPSDAAGAISGTNVNGWRFWHALVPGTSEWRRMDEFK